MSREPSPRVLGLLRAEPCLRQGDLRPDQARLARALEAQGLSPLGPVCSFEERFGGWVGSWTTLGVVAAPLRTSARLDGHALIGKRGPDDFFMAPDGAVVVVDHGEPTLVAGSAEVWLEQLALRRAVEVKQNALYLRLRGAPAADLALDLGARRDEAASDRVGCWALPREQGLLVGPYGDAGSTLALFPSVRAAARCLSLGVEAASVEPIRFCDGLLGRQEAPPGASALALASFAPLRRGPLSHAVRLSQRGQDPVIEQWSLTEDEHVRAHWSLRDGDLRLGLFLGGGPPGPPGARPGPLAGAQLAFDPLLRCGSDRELEELLFCRKFSSFRQALAFDERHGGLSFWTAHPVILGVASALRLSPSLLASEVGPGAPIAQAEGRLWRLGLSGSVEAVDDGDGSPRLFFPTVDAFLRDLAGRARPWRRFPYAVVA